MEVQSSPLNTRFYVLFCCFIIMRAVIFVETQNLVLKLKKMGLEIERNHIPIHLGTAAFSDCLCPYTSGFSIHRLTDAV